MRMDTQAWGAALLQEVELKWQGLRKIEAAFEAGYVVFYSPVKLDPELMIIGFNPGGDASDFDPISAARIPIEHEYIVKEYRIAKRMRSLFEEIGKRDVLERSSKLNLLFFRSSNAKAWKRIDLKVRRDAEQFCSDKIKKIVDTLRPRRVLAEGIETYSCLRRTLGFDSDETKVTSQGRAIVISSRQGDLQLMGMIHPTGARINRSEWATIRESLQKFVA
jgi:hypothetical protein